MAIGPQADIRLVPTSPPLVVPADLEMWVKVAVCGELSPTGEFIKWDEPTWDQHWRQLAARRPATSFPFPGHLARDPLHWLQRKYMEGTVGDGRQILLERQRRAKALADAAEAVGNTTEAARWRRELLGREGEVAPMPRPAK